MDMKLYCPDCGEKLTPYYFQSLVPEVNSYIHMGCAGRCLDDLCKASGLNPEGIKTGITKYTYDAETINNSIARRSDEGRSLPWLEKEFMERQNIKNHALDRITKALCTAEDFTYGKTEWEILNKLDDITNLYCIVGMDKSYACGFLDAIGLMK